MPLDSFRRFRQIIEATAGGHTARGGRPGRAHAREFLSCSFCGEQQKQVSYLIAGPGRSICNRCVDGAHATLASPGATVGAPATIIWRASDAESGECCSFCGKSNRAVEAMAVADGGQICTECLDLCREIIAENPT